MTSKTDSHRDQAGKRPAPNYNTERIIDAHVTKYPKSDLKDTERKKSKSKPPPSNKTSTEAQLNLTCLGW